MKNPVYKKLGGEETLNLLREISANPRITQRQMSSRLDIGLGKVNYLIKGLIEKGLLKVESFCTSEHKAAYIYHLTPAGIEERARITVRFLKKKSEEYERLQEDLRQLEVNPVAAQILADGN
ncbi:MAG: MarR family EPS-associated transcriptional regulator [Syntrophales bacterium]